VRFNRGWPHQPFHAHASDFACVQLQVEHRLTKFKHPWTLFFETNQHFRSGLVTPPLCLPAAPQVPKSKAHMTIRTKHPNTATAKVSTKSDLATRLVDESRALVESAKKKKAPIRLIAAGAEISLHALAFNRNRKPLPIRNKMTLEVTTSDAN
jgi:hypothetical protein